MTCGWWPNTKLMEIDEEHSNHARCFSMTGRESMILFRTVTGILAPSSVTLPSAVSLSLDRRARRRHYFVGSLALALPEQTSSCFPPSFSAQIALPPSIRRSLSPPHVPPQLGSVRQPLARYCRRHAAGTGCSRAAAPLFLGQIGFR